LRFTSVTKGENTENHILEIAKNKIVGLERNTNTNLALQSRGKISNIVWPGRRGSMNIGNGTKGFILEEAHKVHNGNNSDARFLEEINIDAQDVGVQGDNQEIPEDCRGCSIPERPTLDCTSTIYSR
jgi:hypothetical protein